jgi:hypothetical protein
MASAKATTNHNQIRKWVESRGGFPAHVKKTANRRSPGVLRIDYPGFSGEDRLERIDWDTWFDAFDKNKLAFLYQGGRSRFSKLVERATVKTTERRTPSSAKRAASSRALPARSRRTKASATSTKSASSVSAKRTTSHATIKRWVEARGGHPARVKRTGILRIDYPGYSGAKTLERIDWDEWFDAFDKNKLAFLYQDKRNSRFSKLVER